MPTTAVNGGVELFDTCTVTDFGLGKVANDSRGLFWQRRHHCGHQRDREVHLEATPAFQYAAFRVVLFKEQSQVLPERRVRR